MKNLNNQAQSIESNPSGEQNPNVYGTSNGYYKKVDSELIPAESNANNHFQILQIERKAYFETLILDIQNRWNHKINRSSINYRSQLYDLSEELKSYLYTHSIYSNGKKYCSSILQFEILEINSSISFLKEKYNRKPELENQFEEIKDHVFDLQLEESDPIKIKLIEGFIYNHPDKFSQGISIQHPFSW